MAIIESIRRRSARVIPVLGLLGVLALPLAACALDEQPGDGAEVKPGAGERDVRVFGYEAGTIELPFHWIGNEAVFEGDIILPVERPEPGVVTQQVSAVGTNVGARWPNAVIPYTIADSLHVDLLPRVAAAISEWESKTNIRLVKRTTEANYVTFRRPPDGDETCNSAIGMTGTGQQFINLARERCITSRVIHEIGHTVGLWHEHQRGDRDQFVRIHLENVEPDVRDQFIKISDRQCTDRNNAVVTCPEIRVTPYDTSSRMHYDSFNFSYNGGPTITRLDGSYIARTDVLSANDVAGVNSLYPLTPPPSSVTAGPVSANQVWLSWPAVTHPYVAGYIVRRNGTVIMFRDKSGGTGFVDNIPESSWLNYEVFAYDYAGRWSKTAATTTTFTPAGPNRAVPLWRYWSGAGSDHYYTVNRDDAGLGAFGFAIETTEGNPFRNNEFGTVPVYQYFSSARIDHFYTTDWNELGGGAGTYAYEGVTFYVFPKQYAGTVALHRYWNGTDHFYTKTYAPGGFYGYSYERVFGYVYP